MKIYVRRTCDECKGVGHLLPDTPEFNPRNLVGCLKCEGQGHLHSWMSVGRFILTLIFKF